MNGALIQVVLALVLAYSLLSILVSQVDNLILALLKKRSKYLENKIIHIVGDKALAAAILRHPLIRVLKEKTEPTASGKPPFFIEWLLSIKKGISLVVKTLFRTKGIEELTGVDNIDPKILAQILKDLKNDDSDFRKMLQKLGVTVPPKLDEILKGFDAQNIQHWVDSLMEEMTKTFKKYMAVFSFFMGLALACLLNIDSIYMAQVLWRDPSMRALASDTAGHLVTNTPVGSTDEQKTADLKSARDTVDSLLNSGLPVGWVSYSEKKQSQYFNITPENNNRNVRNLYGGRNLGGVVWYDLKKLCGLLITAIAISLGSDFWFNLLRSLTGGGGGGSQAAPQAPTGQTAQPGTSPAQPANPPQK